MAERSLETGGFSSHADGSVRQARNWDTGGVAVCRNREVRRRRRLRWIWQWNR